MDEPPDIRQKETNGSPSGPAAIKKPRPIQWSQCLILAMIVFFGFQLSLISGCGEARPLPNSEFLINEIWNIFRVSVTTGKVRHIIDKEPGGAFDFCQISQDRCRFVVVYERGTEGTDSDTEETRYLVVEERAIDGGRILWSRSLREVIDYWSWDDCQLGYVPGESYVWISGSNKDASVIFVDRRTRHIKEVATRGTVTLKDGSSKQLQARHFSFSSDGQAVVWIASLPDQSFYDMDASTQMKTIQKSILGIGTLTERGFKPGKVILESDVPETTATGVLDGYFLDSAWLSNHELVVLLRNTRLNRTELWDVELKPDGVASASRKQLFKSNEGFFHLTLSPKQEKIGLLRVWPSRVFLVFDREFRKAEAIDSVEGGAFLCTGGVSWGFPH